MSEPSTYGKAWISLLSAVIFLVIASPMMYKITSTIFGNAVAVGGCPTVLGLFLHSFVFGTVTFGTMFVPWERLAT